MPPHHLPIEPVPLSIRRKAMSSDWSAPGDWFELTEIASLAELAMNPAAQDPSFWHLPHTRFRAHQLESILWGLSLNGFGFLEAPTGSGKTGIAAASAKHGQTLAVCRTKNLQAVNYGNLYGAAVLFGKGNYPCEHPDNPGASGDECLFQGKSMDIECEYRDECPYLMAKWAARQSRFSSLNYAYFLLTSWHLGRPPANLFLDEAHQLPDIILDFVGCTVYRRDLNHWDLPSSPNADSTKPAGMLFKTPPASEAVLPWLTEVKGILCRTSDRLRAKDTVLTRQEATKCERLYNKVKRTETAIHLHPDDWFIVSGVPANQLYAGRRKPVIVCRPLTARHHRPLALQMAGRTIMMSATIGRPEVLAEELGIDTFLSRAVPNQWEASQRQVHILDAPKLNHKSGKVDFDKQADVIAEAIKSCPEEWSGLIHVTRKKEAALLAERLAGRGLEDRIWVMPGWEGQYVPTDKQVEQWHNRLRGIPNSLCISWSLSEGYDGLHEKINISAKTPWPYLGDMYERSRMYYSRRFYIQRTAYALEQSLGRTRRGRVEDYGEENGFVAIADGNYTRVKGFLSQSLQEALVE